MTETDQLIIRGLQAKEVLGNETIMSFIAELKSLINQALLSTAPDAADERERLYFQYRSIDDLVGVMSAYSDAADKELELQDAEHNSLKDTD